MQFFCKHQITQVTQPATASQERCPGPHGTRAQLSRGTRSARHSPHAYFEHAAEQLGVIGDDPADVDDQLLLNDRLPLVVDMISPLTGT